MSKKFILQAPYQPAGDQPKAIKLLVDGLKKDYQDQTLLGVTGSGKTFTMASVVMAIQKPTLVISPNKTLAAQLYSEFREFFPENAVHYFVSYYDYYQPEAYVPHTDTYIEKEAMINEEIDRLRHAATQSLLTRKDVLIVASVSCIYGLGDPIDYKNLALTLSRKEKINRQDALAKLIDIQYTRNDLEFPRGSFRVRGDVVEIHPSTGEEIIRLDFFGNQIESITTFKPRQKGKRVSILRTAEDVYEKLPRVVLFPAKHFVMPEDKLKKALLTIRHELKERLKELRSQDKLLEAQRLEQRTNYDLEMIAETGYCAGIENYSRHFSGRRRGEPPATLIDYFAESGDFLTFIDESHIAVPQIQGMYLGDHSRKATLINYGFRLPSAFDNRPLKFDEFNKRLGQRVYVSATPAAYELKKSKRLVEQLIRPTGLLDPQIEVRPSAGQVPDLINEISQTVAKGQRTLVTVLTKRLAEELADYLKENGIKVQYLHGDIKTLERVDILRDLRQGKVDVLVGINLLREGLDLPEVSLIAILDADQEGFLRNETTLIQTAGRAARHPEGRVIMYADKMTDSMKRAIAETTRRRKIQEAYNKKHGQTPRPIIKQTLRPIVAEEDLEDQKEKIAPGRRKTRKK